MCLITGCTLLLRHIFGDWECTCFLPCTIFLRDELLYWLTSFMEGSPLYVGGEAGPSSPKLPLPEASGVPSSVSSGGSSTFSEWFGNSPTGASSSAPAAEGEKFPSPEISQEGESSNPKATASTSIGGGTHFPSAKEIGDQLEPFFSGFSKIRARSDFVLNVQDALNLSHASPAKMEKIHQLMLEISQREQSRPTSGRKAADLLLALIRAWEKEGG